MESTTAGVMSSTALLHLLLAYAPAGTSVGERTPSWRWSVIGSLESLDGCHSPDGAFDLLQALAFGLPAGHPIARTGFLKARSAVERVGCREDAVGPTFILLGVDLVAMGGSRLQRFLALFE
jgi:hypothetical protein